MKQFITFLCVLLYLEVSFAGHSRDACSVTVKLHRLGIVKGSLMRTISNKIIFSFRGMRYAEPPVGDLRFRPAVPIEPWDGILDATQEGSPCPQPNVTSSEDCLNLNVYTAKLPRGRTTVKRPVIVFFHPGSDEFLSSQSNFEGPNYLLNQDVVLVTSNYRLSALGFLSTGDALAPGNLAYKDQVVALRWVQEHIEKFGGDPNLVTIAGCSAGARSVTGHIFSPMSKGLFHRAIVMSASIISQEPLQYNQKYLATKQAEILGCPTDTTENMINCLRTKPAEDFGNSVPLFREWYWAPFVAWLPVVEPDIPGLERFLTEQPMDMIRKGSFNHVPIMIGITELEMGSLAARPVYEAERGNYTIFNDINANWTWIAPIALNYEQENRENSIAISNKLRKFYLHGRTLSLDNWKGYSHLCADGTESFAVHRTTNLFGQFSTEPVWYYKFSYESLFSTAIHRWPNGTNFSKKPGHADDMMYVLWRSISPFNESSSEIKMVEKMTSIWANFAKTGQPIPPNNELFTDVTWSRFTPAKREYMDLGNELVMKTGLFENRMRIWEKLFPLKRLPRRKFKASY